MTVAEFTPDLDQCALLRGASFSDYERLLTIRGESAVPRITFRAGDLELLQPCRLHGWLAKSLSRLLETWSDEAGVPLNGYGNWTIRRADRERGLEPDECYILGNEQKERPDLAIEVALTSGGIDKLDVYRALAVPEVWFWRRGRLDVHVLAGDQYTPSSTSKLLPELDLSLLARFVDNRDQLRAVREYRTVIRALRSQS
ncbi:MAG: Uma2 family endonuclease [Planctomycetes bacterium]|nr:Uma2 family endonuclease [Planctomycetota bacterium]